MIGAWENLSFTWTRNKWVCGICAEERKCSPTLRRPGIRNGARALERLFSVSSASWSISRNPWVCEPLTGQFCCLVASGGISEGSASRQVLVLIKIKTPFASLYPGVCCMYLFTSAPRGQVSWSLVKNRLRKSAHFLLPDYILY